MMPGMDMKKLQKMMKNVEDIPAERVIIEGPKRIIIENPKIMKLNVMGQETFQIIGEAHEEELKESLFTDEDVHLVMEQTGKNEDEVKEALIKNEGDIAKTILELKS